MAALSVVRKHAASDVRKPARRASDARPAARKPRGHGHERRQEILTVAQQLFIDSSGRNDGFPIPYGITNQSMAAVASPHHVRTGSWRSVANTQHGFYTESFIDELATAAGRDPVEYRRDLLPVNSRHRRVLETAADKAGWGTPTAPGVGRGIARANSANRQRPGQTGSGMGLDHCRRQMRWPDERFARLVALSQPTPRSGHVQQDAAVDGFDRRVGHAFAMLRKDKAFESRPHARLRLNKVSGSAGHSWLGCRCLSAAGARGWLPTMAA